MKKSFWVIFMVLVLVCVGAIVLKAEAPKVPVEFEINSDVKHFKDATKKKGTSKYQLVKLTHEKHAKTYGDGGYGCKVCHHELKDDSAEEQTKAKKCSSDGCHSVEPKEKCLELEKAMHQQCSKSCHKDDEHAKAAKAPTKCGDCHVKVEEK